ncbi:MAG: D-alanyl-D-alanine carboxypeptidase [Chloroflexi bacterium]|nr:D-alanyl-D-alanine carboxypeptidase [Chloroflexota bacterium]
MRIRSPVLRQIMHLLVLLSVFLGSVTLLPGNQPGPAIAQAAPAIAPPRISGQAAVVIDDTTGQVVYEQNAHQHLPPASTTKVVTALVALQHSALQDIVRVDVEWSDLEDSTIMGLLRGEIVTLEDLLYGLMLPSGNDAAVAIARHVGGTEERFVQMMNDEAKRLGLTDSHFANPHGLDAEGHYTSPYDLAQFARLAMRNPAFAAIAAAPNAARHGKQVYSLRNINRVLRVYPGATGVKTGYTDNAWQTVVASANRNGRPVYVAVMRSWDYAGDAVALFDYFYATTGDRGAEQRAALADGVLSAAQIRARGWTEPPPPWQSPRLPKVPRIDGFNLWE